MTNYARNVQGCWIDVYQVPSAAFADLADLQRKLGAVDFVAVNDAVKPGDFVVGQNGYSARPVPEPVLQPRVLSKTSFQDLAVANLGGAATGMARFQKIMDDCAAGAGAIRYCFSRYEAALTFAKDQVESFTTIMVQASIMSGDERSAVLNGWPKE